MTFHHTTKIVQLTELAVRYIITDFSKQKGHFIERFAHFDNSWLTAEIQLWTVITN